MAIDQLIFVGLNGYALALDRNSGEIVWSNNEMALLVRLSGGWVQPRPSRVR